VCESERRAAVPGLQVHPCGRRQLPQGDKVAARFLCSGTQRDSWQGHPASGQRFERVAEVYFLELHEGRITRAWGPEDNLSRMQQLGHLDQHAST
jgi:predicted ester cyclase